MGLILWESCCIPSLIYDSSCWVGMGKKEEAALSEDFFLRLLFGTEPGAPKVALRADSATLSMSMRVKKEKILLVKHIRELEEEVRNSWSGLAKETSDICRELFIEDVNTTNKGKAEYSKDVKEAIRAMEEVTMKKEMGDEIDCMTKMKMKMKKDYMRTGTPYSVPVPV